MMPHQTVHAPDPINDSSTTATNTMNSSTQPIVIPLQRERRGALPERHWIYRTATPPGTKLHYVIPTNHSPISARNTKCPLWNAVVLQRQLHPPRGTTIARDVPVLSIPIPLENSTFHSRRKYQIRNSNISAMLVHVRSVNRYQVYTCEFSRKNEAPGNSTPA